MRWARRLCAVSWIIAALIAFMNSACGRGVEITITIGDSYCLYMYDEMVYLCRLEYTTSSSPNTQCLSVGLCVDKMHAAIQFSEASMHFWEFGSRWPKLRPIVIVDRSDERLYQHNKPSALIYGIAFALLVIPIGVTIPYVFLVLRAKLASPKVGRCASCGYDLRASPERCPECGIAPSKLGRGG